MSDSPAYSRHSLFSRTRGGRGLAGFRGRPGQRRVSATSWTAALRLICDFGRPLSILRREPEQCKAKSDGVLFGLAERSLAIIVFLVGPRRHSFPGKALNLRRAYRREDSRCTLPVRRLCLTARHKDLVVELVDDLPWARSPGDVAQQVKAGRTYYALWRGKNGCRFKELRPNNGSSIASHSLTDSWLVGHHPGCHLDLARHVSNFLPHFHDMPIAARSFREMFWRTSHLNLIAPLAWCISFATI